MRTHLLALLTAAFLHGVAHAQLISSQEIERGLNPVYYPPYDGKPFTQRYNFSSGGNLYLNGDSQRLWDLYYYDKLERSLKFGYKITPDTARYLTGPVVQPDGTVVEPPSEVLIERPASPSNVRIGIGIGVGTGYGWRRWR